MIEKMGNYLEKKWIPLSHSKDLRRPLFRANARGENWMMKGTVLAWICQECQYKTLN